MKVLNIYLIVCVAFGLALSLTLSLATASEASSSDLQGEPIEVVVASGDTVWSIASQYGVEGVDTRRVVYEIEQMNGLTDYSIQPGQVLIVPGGVR